MLLVQFSYILPILTLICFNQPPIANSIAFDKMFRKGLRGLIGSNCIMFENGKKTPVSYCKGCLIEEAIACVTDMRYNKTGAVPYNCNLNKIMQTYESQCCPQSNELGRLTKRSSAYPFAFSCLKNAGCDSSVVQEQLMAECSTVCGETGVCAPYPNYDAVEEVICFSELETVQLNSGETKFITNLNIGDLVLTSNNKGNLFYSPVVAIIHQKNKIPAIFHHIKAENGIDIRLSKNHLILNGECNEKIDLKLVYALNVQIGSCIMTVSGLSKVISNDILKGEGVYSFVTLGEFPVVSGVVSSPFAFTHSIMHLYYNIYRIGYVYFPNLFASDFILKLTDTLSSSLTSIATSLGV